MSVSAHDHKHHHHATGNIRIAFFLNLFFTAIEIAGGLYTNSLAILSDALHDLGDSFTLGVSWYLERKSRKGRDVTYSYGYRRFSLLGALITGAVLIAGGLIVVSEAIPRLLNPEPANARGMLVLAMVGVAVNGAAALRLRGERSINARMAALHLLEDVLGWIAVLIVGVILLVWPLYILDAVLSLAITAYVVFNAVRSLKKTLSIFLQAAPRGVDVEKVGERISAIDGVVSVHHMHSWSLDGEHHVLTAHVVLANDAGWADSERVKREAKALLREFHFSHATIEVEHVSENCTADE